ncbi:MAG: hypothetical protein NZ699_15930 [Roseiflexus sp.]|nr:hypothetical protein [Roseiflexus sp.]MDW8145490.1 hypothetical protein [Roseiflexaceae bacterium]
MATFWQDWGAQAPRALPGRDAPDGHALRRQSANNLLHCHCITKRDRHLARMYEV